jgi:ribonucleoside-diphosphate reductase alpha chain
MGHVKMMGAVQPFISGAISKTINMPNDATIEDIMHAYMESWKLGLKAIAIYRDGSKRTQPLNTAKDKEESKAAPIESKEARPLRRRLSDERPSITHKFDIAGHEGYITVGKYEDGQPGEIFIKMSKEGSTISGLMDSFATAISMSLQYGVPLRVLVDKFSHMRFEPSGFTKNPDIPMAKSIMDYIFRWLATKFLDGDAQQEVGIVKQLADEEASSKKVVSIATHPPRGGAPVASISSVTSLYQQDAPPCPDCGAIMIRSGACYKCMNCGAVSGCS